MSAIRSVLVIRYSTPLTVCLHALALRIAATGTARTMHLLAALATAARLWDHDCLATIRLDAHRPHPHLVVTLAAGLAPASRCRKRILIETET